MRTPPTGAGLPASRSAQSCAVYLKLTLQELSQDEVFDDVRQMTVSQQAIVAYASARVILALRGVFMTTLQI